MLMLNKKDNQRPDATTPHGDDTSGLARISCRRIGDLLREAELGRNQRDQNNRQYVLVEQGGGVAVIDNQEFPLYPGSFLVVPANALHRFVFKPGTDGFVFAGAELFMRTQVAQALFTTPASFWESFYRPDVYQDLTGPQNAAKRRQLFAEVAAAASRFGLGCDAAVMGYIFVLLTEDTIPNRIAGQQPQSRLESSDTHLVYRFQILVEKHYRKHYPIEDYCRMLGVTRAKLIDTCKQVSKLTPLEIVHRRLVMEAKRDLLNTAKTINEIAFDLGFADSAYFSRFFKKQTGMSPVQFRHPEERPRPALGSGRALCLVALWAPCLAYETQRWMHLV